MVKNQMRGAIIKILLKNTKPNLFLKKSPTKTVPGSNITIGIIVSNSSHLTSTLYLNSFYCKSDYTEPVGRLHRTSWLAYSPVYKKYIPSISSALPFTMAIDLVNRKQFEHRLNPPRETHFDEIFEKLNAYFTYGVQDHPLISKYARLLPNCFGHLGYCHPNTWG